MSGRLNAINAEVWFHSAPRENTDPLRSYFDLRIGKRLAIF